MIVVAAAAAVATLSVVVVVIVATRASSVAHEPPQAAPSRESSPAPIRDPTSSNEDGSCAHPLLPPLRAVLEYSSGLQDGTPGRFTLERVSENSNIVTWRMSSAGRSLTFLRHCDADEGVEDPWFAGPLVRSGSAGSRIWRFPPALSVGLSIRGSISLATGGGDEPSPPVLSRVLTVMGMESVTTGAGRFEVWRVAYRESIQGLDGMAESTGNLWLAPSVGLVKSVDIANGRTATRTLEHIVTAEGAAP